MRASQEGLDREDRPRRARHVAVRLGAGPHRRGPRRAGRGDHLRAVVGRDAGGHRRRYHRLHRPATRRQGPARYHRRPPRDGLHHQAEPVHEGRRRDGAVGHRGQGGRSAGVPAPRREDPRPRADQARRVGARRGRVAGDGGAAPGARRDVREGEGGPRPRDRRRAGAGGPRGGGRRCREPRPAPRRLPSLRCSIV